ncbi:hypothetical protein D3C71_1427140 [compost metagenome]
MRGVDIRRIGVGLVKVAVQAHGERVAGQRAAEAKVGAFRCAFLVVFRLIGKQRQAAMPVIGGAFGDDINHTAGGTGTVTRRRRPTQHFDALNHFRRHPVGIAAGVPFAAPAVANRIARRGGDAVD